MKKPFLLAVFFLIVYSLFAQEAPEGFVYQFQSKGF